jgi:hypothetical protein
MTVGFDIVGPSATAQAANSPLSLTWAHTCTGSERVLVAFVAVGQNSGSDATKTISGVTYAGTAMTSLGIRHSNNQTAGYIQGFALKAPALGANDIVATFASAPSTAIGGSLSFSNADQVIGWGTPVLGSGATTTATNSVPSTAGGMIAFAVVNGADLQATPTSPATLRYLNNFGHSSAGGCSGAATIPSTGSPVTCSWGVTSDWWAEIAVEIKPSATAAPGTNVYFSNGAQASAVYEMTTGGILVQRNSFIIK